MASFLIFGGFVCISNFDQKIILIINCMPIDKAQIIVLFPR